MRVFPCLVDLPLLETRVFLNHNQLELLLHFQNHQVLLHYQKVLDFSLGFVKGPVAVAAEIGAEMALEPVAKAGGRALTRTILDIMGKGNRARQVAPSLYGKAGPDFTPDIAQRYSAEK